jgi:peroxiredoxin
LPEVQILVVSNESPEDLSKAYKAIAGNNGKADQIIFLSDTGHKVIDRYGILNESSRGLPHPATYVIDKQGVVRWKFIEVDYRVRPTNRQILDALEALN